MKNLRKAVAMIELIFAIVVMGIAMLAIPNIAALSLQGTKIVLLQESISEAASSLNLILSSPWDTVYNIGANSVKEESIIATDSDFFKDRKGLNNLSVQGSRDKNETKATAISDNKNGLEGYDGVVENIEIYSGQENSTYNGDYIDTNVAMKTTVRYYPDNITPGATTTFNFNPSSSSPTTTNIKRVTINLTTTNKDSFVSDKNITLHAFGCNIGSARASTKDEWRH